jgi:hypothetical protein
MRWKGINYDVGVEWGPGRLSRPMFDSATTRREMEIIKNDLHCNAVRISGGDPDRLGCAAEHALALGLEVWLSPQVHDKNARETLAYITECAAVAEGLRKASPNLVFILGCELTLFMKGIVKGGNFVERLGSPLSMLRLKVLGSHNKPLNAFLAQANDSVRGVFGGQVTYASAPIEAVNWDPFDFVCLDYYRGARNRDSYGDRLKRHFTHGKPVIITEVGCCTYRGAEDKGPMGWTIVDRHDPRKISGRYRRDEALQAREVIDMLKIVENCGVAGAFVFTWAAPALPYDDDPMLDLDMASYAIVKSYATGHGERYLDMPWEPKELFDALAQHYRT